MAAADATVAAESGEEPPPAAAASPAPAPEADAELRYPVRRTTFFPSDAIDVVVEYRYVAAPGDEGLLLSEELTYDHAGELLASIRYDHDAGAVASSSHFDAEGKLQSQHVFQHDAAGRVVVDTTQDAAGRVRSESRYAYDDQGRRTEWRLLGGRGELLGRSVYRYEGGEVAEAKNFDGAGALQETVAYSRDGDGRLRSELVRDATGTELTRDDRSYAGRVLQSVAYFSAGALVGSERFEYDTEGFLTRTSSHGADDALKSYVVVDYALAEQLASP